VLDHLIDATVLERRRAAGLPRRTSRRPGVLAKYAALVGSAATGAACR